LMVPFAADCGHLHKSKEEPTSLTQKRRESFPRQQTTAQCRRFQC
jgi:hypothetical protein